MATAEEILSTMADDTSEYEDVCLIDTDARTISIPEKLKIVGVESDEDVVRRTFRMPWRFGENDLSTFTIRINYLNAHGEGDIYPVKDMAKSGDDMTFSWLLSRHATKYKGNIRFVVCMILPDRTGIDKEWNTTLAEFTVLEGLETSGQIEEDNPDVIESILLRLNTLESTGGVSDEQIGNAVNDYLTKNPIQPGATQEQAEQIEANKKAIEELQQNGAGGGITEETDPTVPAWAKADTKPKYTADEVGALPNTTVIPTVPNALKNPYPLTINGVAYDGSEAKTINIQASGGGESVSLDTTLTQYGMAADAGAVGNALEQEKQARNKAIDELKEAIVDEVHVGKTEPTDPSVKVWINPEGEATIPGGTVEVDTTLTQAGMAADAKVTGDRLNSLNEDMVTKLNPAITKSGNVVKINAMPGLPMKIISDIIVSQSGEGTPSPDNVRPFAPQNSATVTVSNGDKTELVSAQFGEDVYFGTYDFSTGLLTVTGGVVEFMPMQREEYGDDGFALYQMWSSDNLAVSDGNSRQVSTFAQHKYAYKSGVESFYVYGDTYNVNSAKWGTLEEAQAWFASNDARIAYTLETPYTVQVDPQVILALEGENTVQSSAGDVTVTAIGTMSVLEQTQAQKYGMSMLQYVHMPRLLLSGLTEGMTKENEVVLAFEYRGAEDYTNAGVDASSVRESGVIHNGYVKIKWQGSSSLAYPKKNYTIKTYADEACEEKLPITFRTRWGAQTKYCLKANYIDPSHSRNVVAAKLWADCVKTRNKTSESYLMMNTLPNYGAVDGYPILVFINDEYVGLYTLNIPKDEWMFGMKDGEGGNAVLCAETYNDATNFSGPIVGDGSDWKFEVSPAIEANAIYSFNQIYAALSMPENTEDEIAAKKAALEPYCDIYSVIDYDIFIKRIGATDNMGKNQLFARYFGKWCASAYDMDTAFGNFWSGVKYLPATQEIESNNLGATVARLYPDIYNARKTELHNGVLSAPAILDKLFNFMIDVPQEAYLAEAQLWPEMCGANANVMQQIAAFVMMHCD